MKKVILISCLILISTNFVRAQEWQRYFQFGIGTGYLMDADINDTPFLLFEYGKSYKWVDIAAALEYARYYKENYLSLTLKTKADFVKMFRTDSRHSFKLGIGMGIGTTKFKDLYNSYDGPGHNYVLFSTMASYEFKIVDKTWLGVFFNNYSDDTFLSLNYLSLSIRRNF